MTTTAPTRNGFDMQVVQQAAEDLAAQPSAARVTFRGVTSWERHVATEGRTVEMQQGGERVARSFSFHGDHPPALLGEDTGPTAGEVLLAALGACVAGTYAAHAAVRGITVDALDVEVAGSLDLRGYFQLDPDVRAGFDPVDVTLRVAADASPEQLSQIAQVVEHASPVFDSLSRGVQIRTALQKV